MQPCLHVFYTLGHVFTTIDLTSLQDTVILLLGWAKGINEGRFVGRSTVTRHHTVKRLDTLLGMQAHMPGKLGLFCSFSYIL